MKLQVAHEQLTRLFQAYMVHLASQGKVKPDDVGD